MTGTQSVRPGWRKGAIVLGAMLTVAAVVCHIHGLRLVSRPGNERLLERADEARHWAVTLPLMLLAGGVMTLAFGFSRVMTRAGYLCGLLSSLGLVAFLGWVVTWSVGPRLARGAVTLKDGHATVRFTLPPDWVFAHGGQRPERTGTALDPQGRARLSVRIGGAPSGGTAEEWETASGRVEVTRVEAVRSVPFVGFRHAVEGEVRVVRWHVRVGGLWVVFNALLGEEADLLPVVREMVRGMSVTSP